MTVRMSHWLRSFFFPRGQRASCRRSQEVRLGLVELEERRVFYAGAATGGGGGSGAPTTSITLDSSQNLRIADIATLGKADQLTLRLSASGDRFEIADSQSLLTTNIAGATGSNTQLVSIPVAAVTGSRIVFELGAGNDQVQINFAPGALGKSVSIAGGLGDDCIEFVGGNWSTGNTTLTAPANGSLLSSGSTGVLQSEWSSVELVRDQTAAVNKRFETLSAVNLQLQENGIANDRVVSLAVGGAATHEFLLPSQGLTLFTRGGSHELHGFNPQQQLSLTWIGLNQDALRFTGSLDLRGGSIGIATRSIQLDGQFRSSGAFATFDAGSQGELFVNGTVDTSKSVSNSRGGTIFLLGNQVTVRSAAVVDASGTGLADNGGEIFVGGSFGGTDRSFTHSQLTCVEVGATIRADAGQSGTGGRIAIWSDGANYVLGAQGISARGGANSGNGGLIETGSYGILQVEGGPQASAANGNAGLWRVLSRDTAISEALPNELTTDGRLLPSITRSLISASAVAASLNGGTNVLVNANARAGQMGNVTLERDVAVVNGGTPVSMQIESAGDFAVNAALSSTGRGLNVMARAGGRIVSQGGVISNEFASTVGTIDLEATSIGTLGAPLGLGGGILTTRSTGPQYLASTGVVEVESIQAGSAGAFLYAGEFHLRGGSFPALTMGSQAVLTGTGTIRSLTAQADGTIRPGDAPGQTTVLNILQDLLLEPGATLRLDLNAPYLTAGTHYDQLMVGGNVSLEGAILQFDGGQEVITVTESIVLIDVTDPQVLVQGRFARGAGSLDGSGEVRVGVVQSVLFFFGGDGNDVVLRDSNVIPAWGGLQQVPLALRAFEPPRVLVLPPGVATSTVERQYDAPPVVEQDLKQVRQRVLVIARLVPNAAGTGFDEQPLLRLNEEWLKNLAEVFRRLPDDRYRVTLVLEEGDTRRVMDVIIRDGRPYESEAVEPKDVQAGEIQPPEASKSPANENPPAKVNPPAGMTPSAADTSHQALPPAAEVEEHTVPSATDQPASIVASLATWAPALALTALLQQRARPKRSSLAATKANPHAGRLSELP